MPRISARIPCLAAAVLLLLGAAGVNVPRSLAVEENPFATPATMRSTFAVGSAFSMAVKTDGSLWVWGQNGGSNMLGLHIEGDVATPQKVTDNVAFAAAATHMLAAVRTDGSLWVWGNVEIQMPDGTQYNWPLDEPVRLLDGGVTGLAAGGSTLLILMDDGSLWGYSNSKLGISTGLRDTLQYPAKIAENVTYAAVCSESIFYITSDSVLWAMGENNYARLGIGWTDRQLYYEPVRVMDGVASVSCDYFYTLVVKTDGSLWGWGQTASLGVAVEGRPEITAEPIHLMDGVAEARAGSDASFALKRDGSLWGWGGGYLGTVGVDERSDRGIILWQETPVPVLGGVVSVRTMRHHTLALSSDGTLRAWGSNYHGQLGNGMISDSINSQGEIGFAEGTDSPIPIRVLTDVKLPDAAEPGPVTVDVSNIEYLAMSTIAYCNVDRYVGKPVTEIQSGEYDKLCDRDGLSTWGRLIGAEMDGWTVVRSYGDPAKAMYAVTLAHEERRQRVLAYRGSQNLFGSGVDDWLEDVVFGARDEVTMQFGMALEAAADFIAGGGGYALSFTGHSLGGGLAYLASCAFDLPAVGFDPAPTIDVAYAGLWRMDTDISHIMADFGMGRYFRGTDAWKGMDYTNENCPVGGIEDQYRPSTLLESLTSNPAAAHDRKSIVVYQTAHDRYTLADTVSVNTAYSDQWLRGKNIGTLSNLLPGDGIFNDLVSRSALLLGTSVSETIQAKNTFFKAKDILYGGDGHDFLLGHKGNDVLIGGRGDDLLDGGSYDDIYICYRGDGFDTIEDISGKDTLFLLDFADADLLRFTELDERKTLVSYDGEDIVQINLGRGRADRMFTVICNNRPFIVYGRESDIAKYTALYNYITAACPVSIDILNADGELLLTLADGEEQQVYNDYGHFGVTYDEQTGEYIKTVERYGLESAVVIRGAGTGVMQYTVEDEAETLLAAYDLPVTADTVIEVSADGAVLTVSEGGAARTVVCEATVAEEADGRVYGTAAESGDPPPSEAPSPTPVTEPGDGADGEPSGRGGWLWLLAIPILGAAAAGIAVVAVKLRGATKS